MGKFEAVEYTTQKGTATIRHAEIRDAGELIQHIKKVDTETTFLMREADEFALTVEQEEQFLQSKLSSEVDLMIIAEVGGKVIGSCALAGSTRRRTRHCASFGIAIEKEYCGIGIGGKMMEAGIDWARNHGISRITLQVDTNNLRAISLYMKYGFEVEGTLRNDKRLADGTFVNSYTMALLL